MELKVDKISKKKFKFKWKGSADSSVSEVEVSIPDLTKLKYSIWGDWGPMYTFDLDESELIQIRYNGDFYLSEQRKLKVNSPIFTEEREKYPFFLIVESNKKDVSFHLYLNTEYEFEKFQIIRNSDKRKLFESREEPYFQEIATF